MPNRSNYRLLDLGPCPAAGPLADAVLLDAAAQGPVACLWQAGQGLVVPRTYAARPGFADAQAAFAAQGWPIHVRQSGGGVVPQGPGILNLSLAQRFGGRPLDHAESFYQLLCGLIATSLLFFGIEARAQAVAGSFCDGRYNLAVGHPARKIAGTAQWWRRMTPGQPAGQAARGAEPARMHADAQIRAQTLADADADADAQDHAPAQHIGLVHALILVQCDIRQVTRQANALEAALNNPRRYAEHSAVSLDHCLDRPTAGNFIDLLRTRLEDGIRRCPAI